MPIEIAGEEKIIRAIKSPHHIDKRKNKLRHQAFRSHPGTDEVSVIRHQYMGSDFCKAKAKEIAGLTATYVGLAVLRADAIRETGSTIHDSREEFCGHAHISHGIVQPLPHEPLPSSLNMVLTDRHKALRDVAVYHADPDPSATLWTGAVIL